jgi:single stranded DNA-binding protein
MSKVSMLGVLGADAKVNQVNDERLAVNFSICENYPYKGKDGTVIYVAQWFNVSYFSRSDKMAKYLTKGKKVFVSGTLRFSEFKNEKTGSVIKTNEIIADYVEPTDWKTEGITEATPAGVPTPKSTAVDDSFMPY